METTNDIPSVLTAEERKELCGLWNKSAGRMTAADRARMLELEGRMRERPRTLAQVQTELRNARALAYSAAEQRNAASYGRLDAQIRRLEREEDTLR